MKIRQGFVSNSSSSSFIVAFKDSEPCKACGRKNLNIADLIERSSDYYDDNHVRANGKKEVLEYVLKEGWPEDKKLIDDIKKLSDDYSVVYVSVSYHDATLRGLIHSPGFEILYTND